MAATAIARIQSALQELRPEDLENLPPFFTEADIPTWAFENKRVVVHNPFDSLKPTKREEVIQSMIEHIRENPPVEPKKEVEVEPKIYTTNRRRFSNRHYKRLTPIERHNMNHGNWRERSPTTVDKTAQAWRKKD